MYQCAISLCHGSMCHPSAIRSIGCCVLCRFPFHPWTVQPLAATSAIVVDNQGCLGIGRRPSRCYYGYNNEYVITTTVELQPLLELFGSRAASMRTGMPTAARPRPPNFGQRCRRRARARSSGRYVSFFYYISVTTPKVTV